MRHEILTIGHSNHTTEEFLRLLKLHEVTAIADVRSSPRTKVNPDFAYPRLEKMLQEAGISYVFLGEELGARSPDESCYEEGKVVYDRLAKQHVFQQGLDRVEMGAEKHRIALMCAEKEPLECHRFILVSRHLVSRGLAVCHILADGSLESHGDSVTRLKRLLKMSEQQDMFLSGDELTELAYRVQGEKIAYELPEPKTADLHV